jgi:hypothetical protein
MIMASILAFNVNKKMTMDLEIKFSDLRKIINSIFDHIEQDLKISSVHIEEDDYWDIFTEDLYNPLKDPAELGLGKLYDDWDFLKNMLSRPREEAVSLMMIHVAPLLRYIGEKIGQ